MKRLILHIGDHKTGTSALQRKLASGVADGHALYPLAGRIQGCGHQNLAWQSGGDRRFKPKFGGWPDVAAEVAASDRPDIIISAEAFEFQEPEPVLSSIVSIFGDMIDRVDIIVYLRAHADRITSSFAERMKRGIAPFCLDTWIEQSLAERRFHYAPRLGRWQDAATSASSTVGAPAFQVLPIIYDKNLLEGGDIVTDFLRRTCGVATKCDEPEQANAIPSGGAIELMCSVFTKLAERASPADCRRAGQRVARAAMTICPDGPPPSLLPLQARNLAQHLCADAENVDAILDASANGYFSAALQQCTSGDTLMIPKPDAQQVIDCLSLALLAETAPPPSAATRRITAHRIPATSAAA